MPKFTTTVSVQVDIDTDDNTAVLFADPRDSLEIVEIRDWDGNDVEDETVVEQLNDVLTALDWSKVFVPAP